MSEIPIVFLEDIADRFEETMEHWEQYLNKATGKFVALSDGAYIETDEELAEEIENSHDYIRLPNQHEIHEYHIMEDFATSTADAYKRKQLFRALNGRKPFRHFKDTLHDTGLDAAYYAFRFLAFVEIARTWCVENNISYKILGKQEGK